MKYTETQPAEPGWYFYKIARWKGGHIAKIYLLNDDLCVAHLTNGQDCRTRLAEFLEFAKKDGGWLWAGPIPEPD